MVEIFITCSFLARFLLGYWLRELQLWRSIKLLHTLQHIKKKEILLFNSVCNNLSLFFRSIIVQIDWPLVLFYVVFTYYSHIYHIRSTQLLNLGVFYMQGSASLVTMLDMLGTRPTWAEICTRPCCSSSSSSRSCKRMISLSQESLTQVNWYVNQKRTSAHLMSVFDLFRKICPSYFIHNSYWKSLCRFENQFQRYVENQQIFIEQKI